MEKSRDQQSALFLYCVFPPVQFPFILAFPLFSLISGSEEKPFILILLRLNVISCDCVHYQSLFFSFQRLHLSLSLLKSLLFLLCISLPLSLSHYLSFPLLLFLIFFFMSLFPYIYISQYLSPSIFSLFPSFSLSQCFFFSLPLVPSNSPLPLLYNGTHYLPAFVPRVSSSPAGR